MLIYSLYRNEPPENAPQDAWVIPFLYDIPADSALIEQLRQLPEDADFIVPLPVRAAKSILTQFKIPYNTLTENRNGQHAEQLTPSRWYPIIDYTRCAGCLECVNFCLFGVYEIGSDNKPVVIQPDVCRNGCPACARTCPAQAIMFPMCEDRKIAGYDD